ncbi:MAG: hypothetical protein JXA79_09875, partial [Deltaproteobacteria bacterium]|nr:hypothetical protein [Deltaproteobacteria bacterium]
ILIFFGLILFLISFLRHELVPGFDPKNVWGPSIFQPPIGVILAVIGFFSLLVSLSILLVYLISKRRYSIINCYSKGILWIYVLHMIIGYRLAVWIKGHANLRIAGPMLFSFAFLLLLISWLIGAVTVLIVHHKRFIIMLRKVPS